MRRITALFVIFLINAATFTAFVQGTPSIPVEVALALQAATPTVSLSPVQGSFTVRTQPGGRLFPGDQVSLEIIAPSNFDVKDVIVSVALAGSESLIGRTAFSRFGIAGRSQATLYWAWDTSDLSPGDYDLRFTLEPDVLVFTHTVTLLPLSQHIYPEPDASWASRTTPCCEIHYITGTAAERDLEVLAAMVEEQAALAREKMDVPFADPISVVFMPRLLGHGGFAGGEIYVSYLDRSYTNGLVSQIIHHEMIHILDLRLGAEYRPSFFVEGLATYQTDGHYKPEPLLDRAVAALHLNRYLLLSTLADDFYPSQHELGYMLAGGLINYLDNQYGYSAFDGFYRSIPKGDGGESPSVLIDRGLQDSFQVSFAYLEDQFLAALHAAPVLPDMVDDLALTVDYFDTIRRYQQLMDPAAYYLTAWLPPMRMMRDRGIVADLLRHPETPNHIALEMMLEQVGVSLFNGNYDQGWKILGIVQMVLKGIERGDMSPFIVHPTAQVYLDLAQAVFETGCEAQKISWPGVQADDISKVPVQVTCGSRALITQDWVSGNSGWQLLD